MIQVNSASWERQPKQKIQDLLFSGKYQKHGGPVQQGIGYHTLQMPWNFIILLKQLLFLQNFIFKMPA